MSSSDHHSAHHPTLADSRSVEEARELDRDRSGWIRKYLDLADTALAQPEDSSQD